MKQNVGFSVSPAALTTGLTHLTVKLSTFVEKPTALQAGTQKVGGNIRILAGSERYTLRAISEANINFLACFFFKHK